MCRCYDDSIHTTVKEGEHNKNPDTLHSVRTPAPKTLSLVLDTLCSGGSTIVLLFEKGIVDWDEDLLINGCSLL